MRASRPTHRRGRNRFAFTLIEILVVVAIIALLISILLPSLAAARRQARIVMCGTNLRTIGQGAVFYAQASKDDMPVGYEVDNSGSLVTLNGKTKTTGNAFEWLYPYVQKVSYKPVTTSTGASAWAFRIPTYRCPDDRAQHHTGARFMKPPNSSTFQSVVFLVSYGANANLLYPEGKYNDSTAGARKVSSVKYPSEIVQFNDAGDNQRNGAQGWVLADCMADFGQENNFADGAPYNQCYFELRHAIGNQFLFIDSHVSFYQMNRSQKEYGLPPFPSAWTPDKGAREEFEGQGHSAPIPFENVRDRCSGDC